MPEGALPPVALELWDELPPCEVAVPPVVEALAPPTPDRESEPEHAMQMIGKHSTMPVRVELFMSKTSDESRRTGVETRLLTSNAAYGHGQLRISVQKITAPRSFGRQRPKPRDFLAVGQQDD